MFKKIVIALNQNMISQLMTKKHQSKRNTAAEGNVNPKKQSNRDLKTLFV